MTTVIRNWPTRISVSFAGKNGQVILDQIRVVDKGRLKKKVGSLKGSIRQHILGKLREIFT
jgi:mRNA interferase MazF